MILSIQTLLQSLKKKMIKHHKGLLVMIYSFSLLLVALGVEIILHSKAEHVQAGTIPIVTADSDVILNHRLDPEMEQIFEENKNDYIIKQLGQFTEYKEYSEDGTFITNDTSVLLGEETKDDEINKAITSVKQSKKNEKKDNIESFSVNGKKYTLSKEELNILYRIVEAEATGEDMTGKILVANVILNRVKDDAFPDTVKDVVFQKVKGIYQFSPIKDKRYYEVTVTKETKEAVKRALAGEDNSEGALYFMSRKRTKKAKWFDHNLKRLFEYGGHEFFTNPD